ncbi:NAD-dependent epimerase/dehydratase family protein [Candidatus Parcubacteria bacterium]|nr:NAD-dependent epimerase/dehydratase family protein [Patescibacteria group bacterium]MCG2694432.1 NAD-dependent epimerase/dehydratase family protein [Candidatus Parcubacteria bacterium]
MKFLVTGGAGFIGSNFTKKALDLGHEVLILDNLSTGMRENIDPRASFYEVDLCDYEIMKHYFKGVDYAYHFAALARVPLSIEKPRETNRNNVESTINVLMAAKENKLKRVVYSASSSAYGAQTKMPLEESMPAAPLSPYGVQKYVGELYVKNFYDLFDLEGVSLRYFNVYGPKMAFHGAYTTAIATFIKQKKEGTSFTIFGDGEITRDFTYVDDVVEANLKAALSPKAGKGEVINIGAANNQSINKIADLIGGERVYLERRKGDPQDTIADITKAKELLDWEPKIQIEEGIRKVKEMYL